MRSKSQKMKQKKRIDDIAKNQNNFKDKSENEIAENGDLVTFDYNATIENKKFLKGERVKIPK